MDNKTTYIDNFFVLDDIEEVNCVEIEPEWIENGYRYKQFRYESEY